MGRRVGRGENPVDFLESIWSPEFREICFLRNPEWLQVVLLFLNARLNSGKYFPAKSCIASRVLWIFLNVVAELLFSYREQIRSLLTWLVS